MLERAIEERVRLKLLWKLVPLLFGLYAFFSLDRGNVGLAALEMNIDLRLSASIYGLGASLFTLAYLMFQIPATTLMRRLGPAKGFALVACAWGSVSMLTAFVWNDISFLSIRFCLGMAEAGFGAFVVYYIGQLFPRKIRGFTISLTLAAVPLTMVVASPISGVLLDWHHNGLRGWQWLFLVEGAPAFILGLMALRHLPNDVASARFLDDEERRWLAADMAAAPADDHQSNVGSLKDAAMSGTVWVLGLTLFAAVLGTNTLLFWMPQIIEQMSKASNLVVGWLNAIPWLTFALGMLLLGRLSDKLGNRVLTLSLAMALSAAGFVFGGLVDSPVLSFIGLLVGAFGVGATMALFWTVPLQMLTGANLAGAIAAINMIGNSSGIFAHGFIGWLRESTGGFGTTLVALATVQVAAIVILNFFNAARRCAGGEQPSSAT
jgi:MFS transporter, ACS family, tartrate transporter